MFYTRKRTTQLRRLDLLITEFLVAYHVLYVVQICVSTCVSATLVTKPRPTPWPRLTSRDETASPPHKPSLGTTIAPVFPTC